MSAVLMTLASIVAAAVIIVRCVCVLYHTHHTRHPRHAWHWVGFGYSYVLLAGAALCGVVAVITGEVAYARIAVGGFLVASAGLIIFDRRQPTCGRADHCKRRVRVS